MSPESLPALLAVALCLWAWCAGAALRQMCVADRRRAKFRKPFLSNY